jgi:hypothetical protein
MKTFALIAALMLASVGCGGDGDSVTAPAETTSGLGSFTFSDLLPVQGSRFYSFTVNETGAVSATLASLMDQRTGPASTSVVRLGLGVPAGVGCSVTESIETGPALTAQLTTTLNPDVYCVEVHDIGTLTTPVYFTVRVVHP